MDKNVNQLTCGLFQTLEKNWGGGVNLMRKGLINNGGDMRFLRARGFTLIELMLAVAIIGLLAAIAIPKFAGLIIKSKEAAVKAKLGSLRSAINIYYADNEGYMFNGLYPDGSPLVPKYIEKVPAISLPTVPDHIAGWGVMNHNASFLSMGFVLDWDTTGIESDPWAYYNGTGVLVVSCTHADSTGRIWSTW